MKAGRQTFRGPGTTTPVRENDLATAESLRADERPYSTPDELLVKPPRVRQHHAPPPSGPWHTGHRSLPSHPAHPNAAGERD